MKPIIIVGTGLAGYTLAREFRKLDRDSPLHILTADDGRFYSKPMLSNGYANQKSPDELAMNTAEQMSEQLDARIETHVRVNTLDPAAHTVTFNGKTLAYQRLVLALGADPIRVPVAGDAADAVLSINDLGDYARFRSAADGRARVAIMGAGLIGCEFANDLCAAGFSVDVIDPAPQALGRLLPPRASESLRQALAAIGVTWHFGTAVQMVVHADHGYRVTLADRTTLDTDVVLSAVGLRPRTALAAAAGIRVNRGIVTDELLATSAADVFALGDCAEVCGLTLPFVMPIMHAARALARTLAGDPTRVRYPAMPVVVKTPALPTVVCPPPAETAGEWEETAVDGGVRGVYRDRDGRLRGFALTGAGTKEKLALAKELPALLG